MRVTIATLAAALLTCVAAAETPTPTADRILQSAKTEAAQGQRAVWVMFHASW
jgi:hypothetical protein